MNRALDAGGFHLLYQPLIELCSGRIHAVEALLRMSSPTLGAVSPDEFIPVAEDCGLILPIGDWVLHEACRQLAQWHNRGFAIRVAVNVSTRQFQREDLVATVRHALAAAGAPASGLELEITEGATLHAPEAVLAMLEELHALSIGLSLDDFGTGYSSLNRLKRLPVDVLKIDKSFVSDIPHDHDNLEIVLSTIQMPKNLHKQSLAEGIETSEQWQRLLEHGCLWGQGFYFSPPVEVADIEDMLRNGGHWGNLQPGA